MSNTLRHDTSIFSHVLPPRDLRRTRDAVVPAVVDKCFGSARQGTKQKGIALVLEYIEIGNSGEGVVVRPMTMLMKVLPLQSCISVM